jgi:hypothetical protein
MYLASIIQNREPSEVKKIFINQEDSVVESYPPIPAAIEKE